MEASDKSSDVLPHPVIVCGSALDFRTGSKPVVDAEKHINCSSTTLPSLLHALSFKLNKHLSAASSTLVELTTRLDFFKERRSQLMEQLHSLNWNYGIATSKDYLYRPSSLSWS